MLSRKAVIGVVGAGECDSQMAALAEDVGSQLATAGITIVCGGLAGVMAAVCRGAKAAGGRTVGILPGTDRSAANPWVDTAIVTGMGEARNAIIVRTAQAVIALGGEYGTLSEIAFALKLGIPVIGLHTWQLARQGEVVNAFPQAQTSLEAVSWALAQLQHPSETDSQLF